MNTEEIITDFEKIIQMENDQSKISEKFTNKPLTHSEFSKGVGWGVYSQGPFYEFKTHPRNPVFYKKPLYRMPYRFPERYVSTYPILHQSPYNV